MKSALQKFRIAIWALMSLVACDSKEPMTSDEAANWVANMKCSFVLSLSFFCLLCSNYCLGSALWMRQTKKGRFFRRGKY